MTAITGSAACVTGAANGIGRALAFALAERGADLALADRDEANLRAVADAVRARSTAKVSTHAVDVADPARIATFAKEVAAQHPSLNILINNAGVALMGQFHEISQADMDWLMNINFWGVVHGTREFLPLLAKQPAAHIVNLSSIFGIIAPPGQTAYAAAKFAVRGFSESLRHELALNKSSVRLTVVHPGGIATSIARNSRVGANMTDNQRRAESISRFEASVETTPEDAALRIIRGIEANEPRVLIGKDARGMDLIQRLMPGTYWATLQRRIEKKLGIKMTGAK